MSVSVNTDSCLSGSPLPVLSFSSLCSAVHRPPSSASRSWSAPPLGRWWCWGCPGWWCSCWWSGTSPSCTRRSAQSLPLCSLVLSSRRGSGCKVSINISFFYFIFSGNFYSGETNLLHEIHVLPWATDGDGREEQVCDGEGCRLQCGDHLPVTT